MLISYVTYSSEISQPLQTIKKQCNMCAAIKALHEFGKYPRSADGHNYDCLSCCKIKNKLLRMLKASLVEILQEKYKDIPKECPGCSQSKLRTEFYKAKGNTDGYSVYCQSCSKALKKEAYQRSSLGIRLRVQRYVQENPQKIRALGSVRGHRYRARKRGLPDTFTRSDEAFCLRYWDYACAICGRQNGLWNYIALDHWEPIISPSCPGTVSTNILPLCHGKKGKPIDIEKCCNQTKQRKDPIVWLHEFFTTKYGPKVGPRKAKKKLAEIEAYFALCKERSDACLAS